MSHIRCALFRARLLLQRCADSYWSRKSETVNIQSLFEFLIQLPTLSSSIEAENASFVLFILPLGL